MFLPPLKPLTMFLLCFYYSFYYVFTMFLLCFYLLISLVADASAGHDTFVAHQWGNKEVPAKQIRTPRHNTNVTKLGNVYAVSGDNKEAAEDEVATASDKEEVAPETYKQAVLDPRWRESMQTEVRALRAE